MMISFDYRWSKYTLNCAMSVSKVFKKRSHVMLGSNEGFKVKGLRKSFKLEKCRSVCTSNPLWRKEQPQNKDAVGTFNLVLSHKIHVHTGASAFKTVHPSAVFDLSRFAS